MMKPIKILSLSIISLLLIAALPAQANTGRVMTMSGDVTVNGERMSKSHVVKSGDKITTGDNSHVNIAMSDRSVLDIRANTKFELEKFRFNKKQPEQGSSLMNLFRGSFRYISGLVGRTNHKNSSIRMGSATIGIRGSFASFDFDGKKAVIDVSLGKITATLANGQTITIEKKKAGEISREKSSTVIVDKGERGTIVFSTGEGKVEENPDPDAVMKAAEAILKNPSSEVTEAALDGMTAAEKAMVVAVLVANPSQLDASTSALTAAVKAVVATEPAAAPLVAAITKVVAEDGETATTLIKAIKGVKGVDGDAVDTATGSDSTGDTGDDSSGDTVGGTTTSTSTSGGGGCVPGTGSPSTPC